jgi:hypothetical protein
MVADGIKFEGDVLRIEAPATRWAVHYDVSVPFATVAHLDVTNGPVEVRATTDPSGQR